MHSNAAMSWRVQHVGGLGGQFVTGNEPHLAVTAGVEILVGHPRGVGACNSFDLSRVDGELRERIVEHGNVVNRGVRSGVARPQ